MLRDITGRSEDCLELAEPHTLGSVFEVYAQQFPRIKSAAGSIVLARNQHFADRTTPVGDGDEIAFLPPVSGGSATGPSLPVYSQEIHDRDTGNFFALTRHPIRTSEIADKLARPEDGAVVHFEGIVRNNTNGRSTQFLEYECYEAMAISTMAEIGRKIAGEWPIGRIAMVHRLGTMEIGEASVSIVVSAPHRKPAFEAALEGINRLKRLVPIWKKEHFTGGEVWVEGEWDESVLGK